MKILHYDCFSGISGDMNLAAMIDLGVEPDYLQKELSKLGLDDEYELLVSKEARNGIHGTLVTVKLHSKDHQHEHHHGHSHHRNLEDIRKIIENSSLADQVKATSFDIFQKVAEAEAKVHDKPLEEVHFHEVGATDSIVDIVGAAICYHKLNVEAVWSSPPELGDGFVCCAHGKIPVPAPATEEILAEIPTRRGGTDIEATTPTGAAILASLVDRFTESPAMTVSKTAYGVGHLRTEKPNLLRVCLATVKSSPYQTGYARLLECNIDDMTGEMLGETMDLLMEQGAMDAYFTPIIMKKNRPATVISLLCAEEDEAKFKEFLFRHTTTLGIKSFTLEKSTLERRFETVETSLGSVTMKQALMEGKVIRSKPEFEDCRKIAREKGIPLAEVYSAINRKD